MAAIVLAAAPQPAAAQGSPGITVDVDECLKLENRDERLACFDNQVDAAKRAAPAQGSSPAATGSAPSAASGAPAAAAAGAAATGSTAAAAASSAPAAPASSDTGHRGERASDPDVVAKIADLRETVPNTYVITLDNGQVWRQRQSMKYPLREGMDVVVKETRFGYRLTAPQLRGQISVERVN